MSERPMAERISEFRRVASTASKHDACDYFLSEVMGAKYSLPATATEFRSRLDSVSNRTVDQILGTQIFALSAKQNLERLPGTERKVRSVLELADARCRIMERVLG